MNHIYKTVFNASLGTWVAVSELATGKHKTANAKQIDVGRTDAGSSSNKHSRNRMGIVAQPMLPIALLAACSNVYALPTGHELVAGQATVNNPAANQMQINQASDRVVINWQGFSVGQNEAVHIQQPHSQAALLNRVVGQDASQIQGKIQANGQVYLVNPNGVLFGKTAQVDVGGLVASTHDVSNADFMAGKNHFSQSRQGGKVENQGTINTSDGGVVALIGESVSNTGTINTPKGTTALAAGKTIDLDMKGDGLVEVKVTEAALNAQIENHGAITADGGRVVMTAKAANSLIDTVINQNGIVKAKGLVERNGEIILDGGEHGAVKVSGELNTTNTNDGLAPAHPMTGGNIQVNGKTITVENTAIVNASGNTQGGTIQIGSKETTEQVTLKQGSSVQANADNGNAGHINVLAKMNTGQVNVQGDIHAKATHKGNGGFIDTSAAKVKVTDTANINTQSNDGKNGTWLIDPYDFKIAATGGDITGTALSTALGINSVTIQTGLNFALCVSAPCNFVGNFTGNGDIFVNDAVSWTANNTLTLNAFRNININANITGSGTNSKLLLIYGQGGGANDDYFVNAKVNLSAGQNFSTKKGAGVIQNYTVITSVGTASSSNDGTLQGMNGNLSGLYALGADIDASSTSTWNSGAGFTPIGEITNYFAGQFHGLGHSISDLSINRPSTDYVGLFGRTNGATLRDVGLVGGSVSGASLVGGLVGLNGYYSIINNSYTTGSVTGTGSGVGGLVGANDSYSSINNSYATGSVSGSNNHVGGLVGYSFNCSINNSYATGSVSGNWYVGGLVGILQYNSTINNSYATGRVSGAGGVGGLVGVSNSYSSINNSYATGRVSGSNDVGGLVGGNYYGNINNSFWDTITTGQSTGVGINDGGTVTNVFGKTTAELMNQSTYTNVGWDFDNVWWMVNGSTRPFLRMEYSTNITNNHQLQMMAMNLGANYTLANNLDLTADLANPSSMWGTQSATAATNITTGFSPIGNNATRFTGSFNGQNHTITGLTINRPSTSYVGLFGATSGATLRDVGLVGGSVTGQHFVGGLVGFNNIYSTINNSYATGSVIGSSYVGELVGVNYNNSSINKSYATGSVSGNENVGGLVGYNFNSSSINNSYATGSVSGTYYHVGGLVGFNDLYSTISSSYATGSVSGTSQVGGLVGVNHKSSINNSYAAGSVSGTKDVGGLVGFNDLYSTINNSFWNTQTTGKTIGVGLNSGALINVVGKTTAEMQTLNTFSSAGWDIDAAGGTGKIWRIYQGYTAPLLRSFLTPLTVTANSISKTYNGQSDSTLSNVTYSQTPNANLLGTATPYGTAINVGTYVPTGLYSVQIGTNTIGVNNVSGYDISYTNGTLTINPAALTITANNQSKTFGDVFNFNGTEFTATGLINGETIGFVDLSSLGAAANASINGSPYDILANNATGGTFNANNYNITYLNGKLTVNPLPVVIIPNNPIIPIIPNNPVIITPDTPNNIPNSIPVVIHHNRNNSSPTIKLIIRNYNNNRNIDQLVPLKTSIIDIKHAHNLRWFYQYWLNNPFSKNRYSRLFNNPSLYLQALLANSNIEIVNQGMKLPK